MMYINGQWVNAVSGATFSTYNPSNGEKIGEVADGDQEDARKSIEAAHGAFEAWSGLTAYQRSEYLYMAYQLMMEKKEHLARVMTEEQGKPLKAAMGEVQYGADFLRWYAEEAKRIYGETISAPRSDQRFIVIRQPVGVVGAITPWNYPMSMITRKVAPALAAGCTIVLKPAEATPLCAVEMFKIFEEARIPAGVVNLVTALNPAPIGETFITHPLVSKITFTGSTDVGKFLSKKAAKQIKRVSLELGGHAPFIVFEDADPIYAAKGAVLVKFLNTGQACISPNRIFVHHRIVGPFIEEFKNRVSKMRAGSGFEKGVTIGPLVNDAALEKVDRQVKDALEKGATLICGGKRLVDNNLDKGFFYSP
ncbi:MAG TPA: NAD-dependent succinate-semialdehyde dehydrogenase, partial [Desulfobacterales bacterium]|nr:NAD-dependent succinate-semialdehyde dehydrogenase [Desulfobacterales bacterium]